VGVGVKQPVAEDLAAVSIDHDRQASQTPCDFHLEGRLHEPGFGKIRAHVIRLGQAFELKALSHMQPPRVLIQQDGN
jgi:hypothetical protein